jgi:hypothetical protein
MISVVVLIVISSFYFNLTTSVIIIQQTLFHVCHRTNNYFVALFIKKCVVFFATGIGPE